MLTNPRRRSRRSAIGLPIAVGVCLTVGLLLAMQARAAGRDVRSAAQAVWSPQSGVAYVPGEVLVRMRAGASLSSRKALASSLGSATFNDLGVRAILPPGQRILLYKSSAITGAALVRIALRNPNVLAASLNYRRYADAVTPNDPYFTNLWGLNNSGQTGGSAGADISAPEAWSITTGSSSVVVASIDTGVAYDHADLAANMWHNPGEIAANGIDDDGNGWVDDVYGIDALNGDSDPYDDHGHGSHTSGTMAGVGNNATGISGVAWQARIMALKFLPAVGTGSTSDAITCIDYVVDEKLNHGVNVVAINASYGGGGYSSLERDAVDAAGAAGIVFCASAGNGGADGIGDDNDTLPTPNYPASYDCANIISVAATDHNDALAGFSNFGATSVDLAAPGVGIVSTVPGVGVSIEDVVFINASQGWAVGEGGTIVATTDGGATWSAQSSGTVGNLYGVAFSDATHGWAVGGGGAIRATTNGGATWSAQTSGTSAELEDVAFSNATHGWAVGDGGAIRATTNGGATWSAQTSGTTAWLFGVTFSDATHGWAVGDVGAIRVTTNGGATWSAQSSGTSVRLYSVAFSDATHGWAVGRDGTIRATTNGGATWSTQSSGTTTRLYGVAFGDLTHGWTVGWDGTIRATTNGGTTWSSQSSGTTGDLFGVSFGDATHGWAAGAGGAVHATTNGGTTWSKQRSGQGDAYVSWDGTSMASPHAAGAVALVAAALPAASAAGRIRLILDNVDPIVALSGKLATGGRLDVAAAVSAGVSDVTAPATIAVGPDADWHVDPVEVSLSALDSGSGATGVVVTEYRLQGAGDWTPYTGPFDVGDPGTSVYEYRSADAAGNVESTKTFTVKIDADAPVTTDNSDSSPHSVFTLVLSPTDATSGVASTEYSLDGGAWIDGSSLTLRLPIRHKLRGVGPGTHVIEYRSTDNAGNVEAIEICTVWIER